MSDSTLSSCIAGGLNVHVHCHTLGCNRLVILSAVDLEQRYGDMALDALKLRLRCGGCGGRPAVVCPRRDTAMDAIRG